MSYKLHLLQLYKEIEITKCTVKHKNWSSFNQYPLLKMCPRVRTNSTTLWDSWTTKTRPMGEAEAEELRQASTKALSFIRKRRRVVKIRQSTSKLKLILPLWTWKLSTPKKEEAARQSTNTISRSHSTSTRASCNQSLPKEWEVEVSGATLPMGIHAEPLQTWWLSSPLS